MVNNAWSRVDELCEKVLKEKAIPIKMGCHKGIGTWHPNSQSCCAGAIMKSPSPLQKFSFGHEPEEKEEEVSQQGRMSSLTSWPRRKRLLYPSSRLLQMSVVVVVVLLSLCLGGVGGSSEDWTAQCPTGCKCTWVSGKKFAVCKGWPTIPSGLSPEVQVLDMSGSTIKTLPKNAFKSVGLVNLQKVHLQQCRIERIDRDAFRDLEIMIELDLSDNLVSSIDMETFETNVRLRELKLSKNPMTKLTGLSFPHLGYLKLLDLSDCQLSTLPRNAFDRLNVLETLHLSGNRFIYLSKEIFKPLTKLKSLSLAGNPWKCDCRLKSLRDWVAQHTPSLYQSHTKCAEPAHVTGFPWDQLLSPDFACRPEVVTVQVNGKATDALLVHTDIGADITLQCLVRGNPPPDLKWVRDGHVLTNNSRSLGKPYYLHIGEESWDFDDPTDSEYRGRWVNLTIQKTDPEDAGEFTCVGSNSGGVVEKNLTLNFQDVPSGGVGHGLGLGGGAYRDTGWIWIVAVAIAVLVIATVLVSSVCYCSRRRRVKTTRTQDLKDDQPQQRQLLLSPSNGEKVDDGGTRMLIMKEKYIDSRSKSTDILSSYGNGTEMDSFMNRPLSAQPAPPSTSLTGGPHHGLPSSEYPPDLLDLPHTRFQESPAPSTVSTLPDSTRMLITPQHLNPVIVNPSRLGYNQHPIYSSGLPMSPFVGGPFSPAEPAIVPAARPGYVTLPRRNRVPSWSPGPSTLDQTSPPSPTGSAATISFPFVRAFPKYDNLGPRTTAGGGSSNNLADHSAPNTPKSYQHHNHNHPSLMVGGTLGRHNFLRSAPTPSMLGQPISHFAPIQEVESVTFPNEDNSEPRLSEATSKTESPSKKQGSSSDVQNSPSKKVPPKVPPKPAKKKGTEDNGVTELNGNIPSSGDSAITASQPAAAIAGDDGTEV